MKAYFILLALFVASVALAQIEDITFSSDELTLEGSLYLPEGAGPFPAAILLHGSGPVNRYQTAMVADENSICVYPDLKNETIENFRNIAVHLYEKGIAVLIYDKRSYTYFEEIDPIKETPKDFVKDAEYAFDFLLTQPKVNPDEIFLAGHSQGATLIPVVAKSKNVAGLISLSGAVTTPDTIVTEQFRNLCIECNNDTNTSMIIANRMYREFERLRNNELVDTIPSVINIPEKPSISIYPVFWRDQIEIAEQVIDNYKTANLPTLFIHGDDDWNVPLNDIYRFENGLPSSLTTVEVFEGVNHLLTTATNPIVSPLVLESISGWIKSMVMPTAVETNLMASVDIIYQNGNIQIYDINPSASFNSILVSSLGGRILYQTPIKFNNPVFIPLKVANQLVNVSLFSDQGVHSQLISIK